MSKYGDYQAPSKTGGHRISVNGDLNPYAFLLVFVHEVAHLVSFETYGFKIKPHGEEWKNTFLELMIPFFHVNVFPDDLEMAVKKSMLNPSATGCVDEELFKSLREYDLVKKGELVENLAMDELFAIPNGKLYRRGVKLKKRYRCEEIGTQKIYLFSPIAEVIPVDEEELKKASKR